MSAHAKSGDGSAIAVGTCGEVSVDEWDEFRGDVAFHLHGRVDRGIPVPAVASVGAYDDGAEGGGEAVEVCE